MTSYLARKAGLSVFEKNIAQYQPVDPLYEEYVDNKGRTKRRRRPLPPGLSARDAKILRKVKARAHYLDKGFRICGMRFGWTFIIGLIPFAGDVADASLNYLLVLKKARQAEIPDWLLHRMLLNNAISAGVGFIPLVGDIILANYKANSRNAALLEEYLRIRGEEFLKAERTRTQDPSNVKPGAGRAAGEVIPGTSSASTSGGGGRFGGLFGSRKGKETATTVQTPTQQTNALPDPATLPGSMPPGQGRFVEDVKR